MRTHTNEFKEEIAKFGRQIKGKIFYYNSYGIIAENNDNILTENDLYLISENANYNEPIEINEDDIFSISIIKNGNLLQSLMKEFDFECKIDLNIGSVVNPHFGLLVNNSYEYLNYGNFIINSKEYNLDTDTWSYICYDKMLFSMIKYKGVTNATFPITIKQYINKLCEKIGLEYYDTTFVNQNQLIYEDVYKNKNVTIRDIFDEISKIVGGNLLINDDDKLEIGYINNLTTKLPAKYTQVDYIQSSGTQYIDTGVNADYKLSIKGEMALINTSQILQMGAVYNDNGSYVRHHLTRNTATSPLIYYYLTTNSQLISNANLDTNKHNFNIDIYNKTIQIDDGNEITISYDNNFDTTLNYWLFGRNSNENNLKSYVPIKIYSFKMYYEDVLVRNFIPCFVNETNEVGLYDLVEGKFYSNKGTGNFVYGNIISETINETYLKDTNVKASNKIGPINSVAIYDSNNSFQYVAEDNNSIKANGLTRITITDNQLAFNNDTQTIADNILNKLKGLYYYQNDFTTTGVCYYDFLDLFNVEARGETYQCLLLNNEITITQGIEEHIFTEKLEEKETSVEEYTTSVLTNKQATFRINQQEGEIQSRVEKDGVISAINQSAEEIQIQANKISLEGKEINLTSDSIVIESTNFSVDETGKITATAGDIGGFLTTSTSFEKELYGLYDYNYFDMSLIAMYVLNRIYLDNNMINILDANESGDITSGDYVRIKNIINGTQENNKFVSGKFELNSNNPKNCLIIKDGNNNIISSIGVGGINSNYISCENFVCGVAGATYNDFIGATINGHTGNITCVSVTQTSKEENKKNFEKLANAKDILNQVDIYKYNFKDEEDDVKKSIGFVIGDNFNYSQDITSENNDGANIYSMVSVLWQVVKEQQEEINELKEVIKNGKY